MTGSRHLMAMMTVLMLWGLLACSSGSDEGLINIDSDGDSTGDEDGDTEEELPDGPVSQMTLGALTVVHDAETQRLTIEKEDGTVVWDGLPYQEIAQATEEDEEEPAPLTGFAVRDILMSYEMQFGAFKPNDVANGPWKALAPVELVKEGDEAYALLQDDDGEAWAKVIFALSGEHLTVRFEAQNEQARRISWGFSCLDNEHFMGFGAQTADVDHRGQTVFTWVQEQGVGKAEDDDYSDPTWMLSGRRHSSHLPIPQMLSSRHTVLTAETHLRATFALCSEDPNQGRVEVELPTTLHFFAGEDGKDALNKAGEAFGRPRLPPMFAFAPWLDAIFGSENVRRVATKLREEGIPSSAIWTEDWRGATLNGDNYVLEEGWDLDRDLYPDMEDLAEDLHEMGFKFLLYANTFVYEGTQSWEETAPNGWLIQTEDGEPYRFTGAKFSDCSLIDLSNPEAYAWAKGKLDAAVALGADGWMGDFAEWMPTDAVTYAGSGLDEHNRHPVRWQELQREVLDGVGDGKDRLFFGRSGWLGTPELADVIWAADQRTSFQADDGMPTILPIGIGLGVVGVSTYGHDIAGYQSTVGNDPSTKELFFRWTTLGAWSPVMRTHHGYQASLNWNWEKDEETIAHFKRWATFHMSLAPYFYSLATEAHETSVPIWRGLGLEFPEDDEAWRLTDEVMVGEGVLLAPVQTEGATSRDVYLPEGTWIPWEGGDALAGGRIVSVEAALTEIPVLVKLGSLVPAYPDGVQTLADVGSVAGPDAVGRDRVVHGFLGAEGSFTDRTNATTFSLSSLDGDLSDTLGFQWEGAALPACADDEDNSCIHELSDRRVQVRVQGLGSLSILNADGQNVTSLTLAGDAEDASWTLDFRW